MSHYAIVIVNNKARLYECIEEYEVPEGERHKISRSIMEEYELKGLAPGFERGVIDIMKCEKRR